MSVVNNQFELLKIVFDSVFVDLQYDTISLTFTAGYMCLCGICSHVVIHGLSVRLSSYPVLWCGGCVKCDAFAVCKVRILRKCVGARVTAMLVWEPGEVWLR